MNINDVADTNPFLPRVITDGQTPYITITTPADIAALPRPQAPPRRGVPPTQAINVWYWDEVKRKPVKGNVESIQARVVRMHGGVEVDVERCFLTWGQFERDRERERGTQ